MRIKKTIFVLSIVLLIIFTSIPVYASPTVVPAYDEDYIKNTANTTPMTMTAGAYVPIDAQQNIQENSEKIARSIEIYKSNPTQPRSAYWVTLPGSFYLYDQTTSYYCVPASVQGILRYINGSTDSQSTIATALGTSSQTGTDITLVPTYLNSKQSKNYYIWVNRTSNLLYSTKVNIDLYESPVMYRMVFSSSDGWAYSTSGHAMNACAIMSDESSVLLADPWMGYAGLGSGSYTKSGSTVYNANTHLIW